jgi:hypothetical protein
MLVTRCSIAYWFVADVTDAITVKRDEYHDAFAYHGASSNVGHENELLITVATSPDWVVSVPSSEELRSSFNYRQSYIM